MTNFETEIEKNGYVVYTNVGDSMMPLLRQGKDLMVIKKIGSPLKKYDVVLFKRPNGAYVLHRIIKKSGPGLYKIAGDNRSFVEEIPEERIIGILAEIIRDGKHVSVTDPSYIKYLKKLPARRILLSAEGLIRKIIGRIKRILPGGNKQ